MINNYQKDINAVSDYIIEILNEPVEEIKKIEEKTLYDSEKKPKMSKIKMIGHFINGLIRQHRH